ncbi:MAG: hypothetical protein QM666_06505 [Acinetobacter sp.]
MRSNHFYLSILFITILGLTACDQKQKTADQSTSQQKQSDYPVLKIQEIPATYTLPKCSQKTCVDFDLKTLKTQDQWLNQWMANQQSQVIQAQIHLNKPLTLQQAIDAYSQASQDWQKQFSANQPYQLHLITKIAYQQRQFVLLQLQLDSKQADIEISERQYFFVADRKQQKTLSMMDIIQPNQEATLNQWVQVSYQDWLKKQTANVQGTAPKTLNWKNADWFFDGEGIGLHYRAGEIVNDAQQLDIYLSRVQTQQLLKADIFKALF